MSSLDQVLATYPQFKWKVQKVGKGRTAYAVVSGNRRPVNAVSWPSLRIVLLRSTGITLVVVSMAR